MTFRQCRTQIIRTLFAENWSEQDFKKMVDQQFIIWSNRDRFRRYHFLLRQSYPMYVVRACKTLYKTPVSQHSLACDCPGVFLTYFEIQKYRRNREWWDIGLQDTTRIKVRSLQFHLDFSYSWFSSETSPSVWHNFENTLLKRTDQNKKKKKEITLWWKYSVLKLR